MVVVWVDNKNEEIVEHLENDPWHLDTQHAVALDGCSLGVLFVNAWLEE